MSETHILPINYTQFEHNITIFVLSNGCMSVTRIAQLKQTKNKASRRIRSKLVVSSVPRIKPKIEKVIKPKVFSTSYNFVTCQRCLVFIPVVSVIKSNLDLFDICTECGSNDIRKITTSTSKLFHYLIKNI